MPVKFTELESIVTANITDHERKLAKAERDAQNKSRSIQRAFDSVKGFSANFKVGGGSDGGFFGGAGMIAGGNLLSSVIGKVGGAMLEGVRVGIDYKKSLENAMVSFTTLTGSAQTAQKHIKDLQAFAAKTPFDFVGLVESSQRLQGMGFKAQQVIPMLTGIGNALSAMGKNDTESIDRVTTALGQMGLKGKAQAEEMMQLAEAGLPAWDLLAKAIGRSVKETQNLVSAGKIKGREAAIAISQQANLKFPGQMDRMSQTYSGLESNFQDILKQRLGEGATGVFDYLKKFYDKGATGLGTSSAESFVKSFNESTVEFTKDLDPILNKIADGTYFTAANKTLGALEKLNNTSAVKSVGGGQAKNTIMSLVTGETQNIQDPVDKAIFGALQKGLNWLGGFGDEKGKELGNAFGEGAGKGAKDTLQINSPSKVFIGIGMSAAEGYGQGLLDGIDKFVAPAMGDMLMGGKKNIKVARLPLPDRAEKALENLMTREPDFIPKLKEVADKLQTKPEWLLQLMALETAGTFNPAIRGGYKGLYTGLIQFGPGARKDVGLPQDTDAAEKFLKGITATQELDYVYKYLAQKMKAFGAFDSLAKLYASVGAGHFLEDDDTVMFRQGGYQKGDDKYNRRISGKGFKANRAWNVNKDGVIQQWEFGDAASKALRLSDALEALGQTAARVTNMLSMAERQALYNPGTTPQQQPQPRTQKTPNGPLWGGELIVDVIGKADPVPLEKINIALPILSGVSKEALMALAPLSKGIETMRMNLVAAKPAQDTLNESLLTYKDIVTGSDWKEFGKKTGETFDDAINELIAGKERLGDAARQLAAQLAQSFFRELESTILMKLTGKSSLGEIFGNVVGTGLDKIFGGKKATTANDAAKEATKPITDAISNQAKTITHEVGNQTEKISGIMNQEVTQSSQALAKLTDLANCSCQPAQQNGFWKTVAKGAIGGAIGGLTGSLTGGAGGGGSETLGPSLANNPGYTSSVGSHGVPLYTKRAGGGSMMPGQLYNINEPGAEGEWFIPTTKGYMLNRHDAQDALTEAASRRSGNGNVIVNNHFHITSPDGRVAQETQLQIATKAGLATQKALRRNT